MSNAHTKEPWRFNAQPTLKYPTLVALLPNKDNELMRGINAENVVASSEAIANGQRIVACVNALAGMNPEALGEVVTKLEQALLTIERFSSFLDHWSIRTNKRTGDVYEAWDQVREDGTASGGIKKALLALTKPKEEA